MTLYEKLLNIPEDEIKQLLIHSTSISDVLFKVGYKSTNSKAWNYLKIIRDKHNIYFRGQLRHSYTIPQVVEAISISLCISDVLEKVGLKPHGGNVATIKKIIVDNNIDITHFNIKEARLRNKKVWKYEEVFCINSLVPRPTLSKYVKRFKLIEYKCNNCGNEGLWDNHPLTLTVDHINGISDDNRPDNLQYLCPNCHSQTSTFGNKKRNKPA